MGGAGLGAAGYVALDRVLELLLTHGREGLYVFAVLALGGMLFGFLGTRRRSR